VAASYRGTQAVTQAQSPALADSDSRHRDVDIGQGESALAAKQLVVAGSGKGAMKSSWCAPDLLSRIVEPKTPERQAGDCIFAVF
jgi:hypothetical protein